MGDRGQNWGADQGPRRGGGSGSGCKSTKWGSARVEEEEGLGQGQCEGGGKREGLIFGEWPKPCATRSDAHLLGWDRRSTNLHAAAVGEDMRKPLGCTCLTPLPSRPTDTPAGIPYSMRSVAGVWVVNFEVRILLMSGLRAGTLPRGAPETGLVAHMCAWCSASVPAEILTLQP